jgi:hypothetical protein
MKFVLIMHWQPDMSVEIMGRRASPILERKKKRKKERKRNSPPTLL